jgi:hypothetical protein
MTGRSDTERFLDAFLAPEADQLSDRVLEAALSDIARTPQRRALRVPWRFTNMPLITRAVAATLVLVAVVAGGLISLNIYLNQLGPAGPPSPEPTTPPEVTELLNGFLDARVAGEGAQQYLSDPKGDWMQAHPDVESDVPLLDATTSGAPYKRAAFERVRGVEWPYGLAAFKVRLFAGDTVVEQLLFLKLDERPLGLRYVPDGFGTHIAPTTEDGQPVAVRADAFDGEVTLYVAHPWVCRGACDGTGIRLIPEGPGVLPTTDGGQRGDWDELVRMGDPTLLGTDCRTGPSPADAEALAESIRSEPDLGATAPVRVTVGGAEARMMDVKIAAGATICAPATDGGDLETAVLEPVFDLDATTFVDNGVATGQATGEWMRLYLFDLPEGSSIRILVIAIVAPEARFESVVEAAAPVVDTIEFHAP